MDILQFVDAKLGSTFCEYLRWNINITDPLLPAFLTTALGITFMSVLLKNQKQSLVFKGELGWKSQWQILTFNHLEVKMMHCWSLKGFCFEFSWFYVCKNPCFKSLLSYHTQNSQSKRMQTYKVIQKMNNSCNKMILYINSSWDLWCWIVL